MIIEIPDFVPNEEELLREAKGLVKQEINGYKPFDSEVELSDILLYCSKHDIDVTTVTLETISDDYMPTIDMYYMKTNPNYLAEIEQKYAELERVARHNYLVNMLSKHIQEASTDLQVESKLLVDTL